MDPSVCREHLANLFAQEQRILGELEQLLEREHEVLQSNDIEALERATNVRQERIGALVRIESERQSLCRMHGYSADLDGLGKLMAWCDPQGSLQESWTACANGASRCRELNDRNGALVSARLRRVTNVLGVLTGGRQASPTYGPHGAYGASRESRVLGEA